MQGLVPFDLRLRIDQGAHVLKSIRRGAQLLLHFLNRKVLGLARPMKSPAPMARAA